MMKFTERIYGSFFLRMKANVDFSLSNMFVLSNPDKPIYAFQVTKANAVAKCRQCKFASCRVRRSEAVFLSFRGAREKKVVRDGVRGRSHFCTERTRTVCGHILCEGSRFGRRHEGSSKVCRRHDTKTAFSMVWYCALLLRSHFAYIANRLAKPYYYTLQFLCFTHDYTDCLMPFSLPGPNVS